MTATAPQIRTKTVDEVLTATFGFASKIGDSGAVIESATVTETEGDDALTIGSPAVNEAAVTVDGVAHAIGEAVQATIAGGTAGVRYKLTCHAVLDSGDELDLYGVLYVEE